MDKQKLKNLMYAARDISIEAGHKIMEIYNKDFDVYEKDDKSPLTEADMASHEYISTSLEALADYPVLSEESTNISFEERSAWETYWLVDPLDGTKQFVSKKGEFCVCIALIHKNEPIMGVINIPVARDTFYACRDQGAFKQDNYGDEKAISCRSRPNKMVVATSRSHSGDATSALLSKIGEHDLIISGSAIKACLVAEGKADLYPRLWPTSEWDTAAAQSIVEEAGGSLTTLDMKPMQYNTKESLVNPYFLVFGDKSQHWGALL